MKGGFFSPSMVAVTDVAFKTSKSSADPLTATLEAALRAQMPP